MTKVCNFFYFDVHSKRDNMTSTKCAYISGHFFFHSHVASIQSVIVYASSLSNGWLVPPDGDFRCRDMGRDNGGEMPFDIHWHSIRDVLLFFATQLL